MNLNFRAKIKQVKIHEIFKYFGYKLNFMDKNLVYSPSVSKGQKTFLSRGSD